MCLIYWTVKNGIVCSIALTQIVNMAYFSHLKLPMAYTVSIMSISIQEKFKHWRKKTGLWSEDVCSAGLPKWLIQQGFWIEEAAKSVVYL